MRWISVVAIIGVALFGCSLEDALEGAPCNSVDDCVGEQECIRASDTAVGVCSSNGEAGGECAAGQQEGCITASDGTCDNFLIVTCVDGTESCYCCSESDARVTSISDDMRSAACVSCPFDLCSGSEASEICVEGEDRCELGADSACGCRIPADSIEDSECDEDATCGAGFVCIRTLEQEPESEETLPEEMEQEPGWCRPAETPECSGGKQEGCRTEDSCSSGDLTFSCTNAGRCYCCGDPAASSDFRVHVYTETAMGESAACVECPRSDCETGTDTCTALEDPDCIVNSGGVCGCTPPT